MPVNGQTQRCDRFSFVEVIARRLKTPNGRRHGMVKAAVCNARSGSGGQNCSWSKIYNSRPVSFSGDTPDAECAAAKDEHLGMLLISIAGRGGDGNTHEDLNPVMIPLPA
jgi:hypothetical protein